MKKPDHPFFTLCTNLPDTSEEHGDISEQTIKTELIERISRGFSHKLKIEDFNNVEDPFSEWNAVLDKAVSYRLIKGIAARLEPDIFFGTGNLLLSDRFSDVTGYRDFTIHYLNLFRQNTFLVKIYGDNRWETLLHSLLLKLNYTVADLFLNRAEEMQTEILFRVLRGKEDYAYSWEQVKMLVDEHACALLSRIQTDSHPGPRVAFMTENSLDMAVFDLACLTTGIVNIMIPANVVPQHLEFILKQTGAQYLIVSGERQLAKVKQIKDRLPTLKEVFSMAGNDAEDWVVPVNVLLKDGESVPEEVLNRRRETMRMDDVATIMYTSGTTGEPKGIIFSQMNLVYKRFCRAMALPEIGEEDRFVCYLPLFHTFGRYLEMLGSVFWGAQYVFLENPAIGTLLDTMKRVKPTIFISIPKKWLELYNHVTQQVDVMVDEESRIRQVLDEATGGKLKWGLSAAGFLEPEIFMFFQKYGVELMSGFGMTEATGGITMTPPGKYAPNSLGKALPGIEVKLADDGEMLIKGPYVMMGYFAIDDEETFRDGWLPTGDIMKMDSNGFYEIIDRKKEIYKNLRGETIAPQKIENLFRDFEFVKQVFLVGDHRLFNTVLIYPDDEASDGKLLSMNEAERQAYFSSIIVTANKFLAPYERIVDFRIVDRPFSADKGELTPKGTYKRKVIEENFFRVIESMYERNYVDLVWKNTTIRIPNWFLREMGCIKQDIKLEKNALQIPKTNTCLTLISDENDRTKIQIGDLIYTLENDIVDFQMLISNPHYWLGNKDLIAFTGNGIYSWYRIDTANKNLSFYATRPRKMETVDNNRLRKLAKAGELSLEGLHLAIVHLRSCEMQYAAEGLSYLKTILDNEQQALFELALDIVSRPRIACMMEFSREVFKLGLMRHKGPTLRSYLTSFLELSPKFLNEELNQELVTSLKGTDSLLTIRSILDETIEKMLDKTDISETTIPSLLNLLAIIGMRHPTRYKLVRQIIVEYQLNDVWPELSRDAGIARKRMLGGFRDWLGENQVVAVDIETGEEYGWTDVMVIEADIDEEDKERIVRVISETSFLREAIFLFSGGMIIRLYDIPQGGLWISRLGSLGDKNLYRVSVQTRYQGAHDIVLIVDLSRNTFASKMEVNWIIHSSALKNGVRLVDEFGGYWPEFHVWSEDFDPGEPVSRILQRQLRQLDNDKKVRLYYLWRFIIWTAVSAHVQFWLRTGKMLELADKSTRNIIVPEHDYQTGERFISIAERKKSKGLRYLIRDFYKQLIGPGESAYSFLKGESIWSYVFSGAIEALGEEEGLLALEEMQHASGEDDGPLQKEMAGALRAFLGTVRQRGYLPRRLFFAIKRFHRWKQLNQDAAKTAQALTLNEFYETYQLTGLENRFPETRTRFFLETVFENSSEKLQSVLRDIIRKQHKGEYGTKETLAVLSKILKDYDLSESELYFLTRLSYPHLKPTDTAFFIEETEDTAGSPGVVVRLEDYDGNQFWIRQAMSPKEISRLHQLFLDNNLPVNFRTDDHFLVAVSERGFIIGGLFYNYIDQKTVHMDKIVVANRFRKKGISEGLMNEFFNRLRDEHVDFVTTGFLRPEYFYRFGFKIERKYAGLVKDLRS